MGFYISNFFLYYYTYKIIGKRDKQCVRAWFSQKLTASFMY